MFTRATSLFNILSLHSRGTLFHRHHEVAGNSLDSFIELEAVALRKAVGNVLRNVTQNLTPSPEFVDPAVFGVLIHTKQ